jgi:hypothetical protein
MVIAGETNESNKENAMEKLTITAGRRRLVADIDECIGSPPMGKEFP